MAKINTTIAENIAMPKPIAIKQNGKSNTTVVVISTAAITIRLIQAFNKISDIVMS